MTWNNFSDWKKFKLFQMKQARKLQATLVRNYDLLSDGGEV